jgi:hypothetical protein
MLAPFAWLSSSPAVPLPLPVEDVPDWLCRHLPLGLERVESALTAARAACTELAASEALAGVASALARELLDPTCGVLERASVQSAWTAVCDAAASEGRGAKTMFGAFQDPVMEALWVAIHTLVEEGDSMACLDGAFLGAFHSVVMPAYASAHERIFSRILALENAVAETQRTAGLIRQAQKSLLTAQHVVLPLDNLSRSEAEAHIRDSLLDEAADALSQPLMRAAVAFCQARAASLGSGPPSLSERLLGDERDLKPLVGDSAWVEQMKQQLRACLALLVALECFPSASEWTLNDRDSTVDLDAMVQALVGSRGEKRSLLAGAPLSTESAPQLTLMCLAVVPRVPRRCWLSHASPAPPTGHGWQSTFGSLQTTRERSSTLRSCPSSSLPCAWNNRKLSSVLTRCEGSSLRPRLEWSSGSLPERPRPSFSLWNSIAIISACAQPRTLAAPPFRSA